MVAFNSANNASFLPLTPRLIDETWIGAGTAAAAMPAPMIYVLCSPETLILPTICVSMIVAGLMSYLIVRTGWRKREVPFALDFQGRTWNLLI